MFSHFQQSRASSRITVTWEDKHHNSKHPPTSPQLILMSMRSYGTEYSFSQLGSAVPAVSPPSFLHTPSLLTGRVVWEAEKALTLCKHHYGNNWNISVLSTLFAAQMQKAVPYELLWRKLTLSLPKPVQNNNNSIWRMVTCMNKKEDACLLHMWEPGMVLSAVGTVINAAA